MHIYFHKFVLKKSQISYKGKKFNFKLHSYIFKMVLEFDNGKITKPLSNVDIFLDFSGKTLYFFNYSDYP